MTLLVLKWRPSSFHVRQDMTGIAAQGMHEGEFIPSLSCPASHHPDWKVSTALLEGSPVPFTVRTVTQSEESLSGEGEATLLPWSLKSLGRRVLP